MAATHIDLLPPDLIVAAPEVGRARSVATRVRHASLRPSRRVVVTLAIVAGIGLLSSTGAYAYDRSASRRLLPGTTIQGVSVGGQPLDVAVDRLRLAIEDPLHVPLRVVGPGLDRSTSPWDLGLRVDVASVARSAHAQARDGSLVRRLWRQVTGSGRSFAAAPTLDRSALDRFVGRAADDVRIDPVDAKLEVVDGWVRVRPGRVGRSLDADAAARRLADAVKTGTDRLELPVRDVEPKVPTSAFASVVLVRAGENKLYLYENGTITRTFGVATGAPQFATPLGTFKIVNKRKNPKWVNPGSDWAKRMPSYIPPGPDNPLGSRALDINSSGIRIHGTPDAGSIGYSVSHGCVRMHMSDAEDLFTRVAVGTPVVIVQAAPPRPRVKSAPAPPPPAALPASPAPPGLPAPPQPA